MDSNYITSMLKKGVETAAIGLGLESTESNLEYVWDSLGAFPLPLSARSLVYQVAEVMGVEPDDALVDKIASRL